MSNDHHIRHLFVCDCSHMEHQFVVSYFDDPDPEWRRDTYVSVHLTRQPFWKRIAKAWRYLCGHQSNFGAFDEILLNPDQCQNLSRILAERARVNGVTDPSDAGN